MARLSILTDLAPYRDRWHAQTETSSRVADLLREMGHTVDLTSDPAIATGDEVDLLIVNLAGSGGATDPALSVHDGTLRAWADSSKPTLALHSSILALRGSDAWRDLLGGAWIPGVSGHPQIGTAIIDVLDHPATGDLDVITAYDERYSGLELGEGSTPLASHVEDGVRHVLAWASQRPGGARSVYDGLGHGVESYDSASRIALLRHELAWLIERP